MKDVETPNWLKELPLAPVFYPTDTEFADPIAYISTIEKEASAFGICKVIPPLPKPSKKYVISNLNKSLLKSPELGNDIKFDNVEKGNDRERAVFTTRHQELGHNNGKRTKEVGPGAGAGAGQPPSPTVDKQVWQSGEIYTLDQFESKSKIFAQSQLGMIKEVSPLAVESLFWKAALEKSIYIEYVNDVPGSGFGKPAVPSTFLHRHRKRRTFNRFNKDCSDIREQLSSSCSVDMLMKNNNSLDGGTEIEETSGWKLSNCPWNLQVIARSPGSLTRFMPDDIPGVTSPMVYIGMLFSWFAWHVEDHELHSLNFLHYGSPKTWYAVPGDYAFTFEEVICSKAYGGINRLAALTLLGKKTSLLSPEIVVASGIPCCRLVQNPGEFVVTFPRAYHMGFSHGFNCGEAANFGTPKWLSVAKEAAVRRAAMNFLPMLSHQQLLYLLTMSFIPRVPKSLLPGIRSSCLKDRQKEERELLVKKEFIEDLLKENKLLNYILQRNSSYRAVQWDIESLLPSLTKESNNLYTEIPVHIEDEDMSSDFQIDSGTLPCVACGVLGYPFMSVIQPSANIASKDSSKVDVEKGWNVSNGYLRPRIFCLEHASKIEEMLDSMGGSKLLIICHSDFQKIKVQASAIAEQISSTFRYNEVQLNDANRDDLHLINLAIDKEQEDETVEDWTLKLNVNLKQSVKLGCKLSSDRLHHALTMDALFPDVAPTSSSTIFQWQATKTRSDKKLKCLHKKLSKKTISVVTKNDSVEQEDSELTKLGGSSADGPVTDSKSRISDENDENNPVSSSASGSKRKRGVDFLQRKEKSNFDSFIKSPCEGLRPRGGKDLHKDGIFIKTKTIPEKATMKLKVSNDVKIPEKHQHGSHKCDHVGCKLGFKNKTELSLHRKNRCPVEGCEKKFSSHRYAVAHLRIHEDSRPLKCSWKGCKMAFKWAWARTEHLRVHTGERPYKCNVEGCGLTFRFVSDSSRHRRKTGHNNVHVKA